MCRRFQGEPAPLAREVTFVRGAAHPLDDAQEALDSLTRK